MDHRRAPGVGKSRLMAEFAAAADATVLRARVRPDVVAPYEPATADELKEAAVIEALLGLASPPG